MSEIRKSRIGIALGSGAARGWSHIGIIRILEQNGIRPDIVCGTSIGALVGAAYASGELDRLEKWVRGLTWQKVIGYFDVSMSGGLIKGDKLFKFFRDQTPDLGISELEKRFGAVATEMANGREIWIDQGSVIDAVRASVSLPGLFAPVEHDDKLLVDGGLVNPVPVSMCRAYGADFVIAVDLNSDLLTPNRPSRDDPDATSSAHEVESDSFLERIQKKIANALSLDTAEHESPSMVDVVAASINIMQVRITRSRLAGEPADCMISPRLAHFALLDFHRAEEAIKEGERAASRVIEQIRNLVGS